MTNHTTYTTVTAKLEERVSSRRPTRTESAARVAAAVTIETELAEKWEPMFSVEDVADDMLFATARPKNQI